MSVQSEIDRIKGNVASAYSAVEEKGGALPEEQNSSNLAEAVRGIPVGGTPGGNPIGTVISYLGTAAPKDYLACDGAVYSVADYPGLADLFQAQFGSKNRFGGDGETTFAVPDMRNLFLRGYHGASDERLSGNVGEKQDATELPNLASVASSAHGNVSIYKTQLNMELQAEKIDSICTEAGIYIVAPASTYDISYSDLPLPVAASYTSRPVNMAVLYCIKAVESKPAAGASPEEIYSAEETRIGTWIDGKPLYRKCVLFRDITLGGSGGHQYISSGDITEMRIGCCIRTYGFFQDSRGLSSTINNGRFNVEYMNDAYGVLIENISYTTSTLTYNIHACFEYTKTAEEGGAP